MKLDVIKPKATWYAEGLNFTCTQCGNCCTGGPGYVWVTEEEIGRLAEHLKLSVAETKSKYCRKIGGQISYKERRSPAGVYDCIFLKEVESESVGPDNERIVQKRRTCSIYPVRPLQCRTWPFWDGNLASKEQWKQASKRCPGMDVGKHYAVEKIESIRTAPDWPVNPPSSGGKKS